MKRIKSQSTIEYSILILISIFTILNMANHIRRSIEGAFKERVDPLGEEIGGEKLTQNVYIPDFGFAQNQDLKSSKSNLSFTWEQKKDHVLSIAFGKTRSRSSIKQDKYDDEDDNEEENNKFNNKFTDIKNELSKYNSVEEMFKEERDLAYEQEKFDPPIKIIGNNTDTIKMEGLSKNLEKEFEKYKLPIYNSTNTDLDKIKEDMREKMKTF